jgi:hypothetical protein
MNRKGISECISKVLSAYTDDIKNATERKIEIIEKLLDKLITTTDIDTIYDISEIFIESLRDRKFYHIFKTNPHLFEKLYSIVEVRIKDPDLVRELMKILIKINENILKDFGNTVTPLFEKQSFNTEDIFGLNSSVNIDEEICKIDNLVEAKNNLEKIFAILSKSAFIVILDYVTPAEVEFMETTFGTKTAILGTKK